MSEATRVLGDWLRDVITANPSNFRLFGPDETASNRLGDVFEVTSRAFDGEIIDGDNDLAPDGRVMEVLSEHLCQGWLEGYLLTGRHGLFNCYEAFIAGVAAGPQRVLAPGPRLHRPRGEQEGRAHQGTGDIVCRPAVRRGGHGQGRNFRHGVNLFQVRDATGRAWTVMARLACQRRLAP
jgi:hypothetical protein